MSLEEILGRRERCVPTGLPALDRLLGAGLAPGSLTILAAPTGQGSTGLLLTIARAAAIGADLPTTLAAAQASSRETMLRLLSAEAGIDRTDLEHAGAHTDAALIEAAGRVDAAPLVIDADPAPSVSATERSVTYDAHADALRLYLLDGVHQLSCLGPARETFFDEAARRFKLLAHTSGVAVVLSAKTDALTVTGPVDSRVSVADLGRLAPMADHADAVVILRTSNTSLNPSYSEWTARLTAVKSRRGPLGEVEARWEPQFSRFLPLDGPR